MSEILENHPPIKSKGDLAKFVMLLRQDFLENSSWENANLDHFLEALSAYIEDTKEKDELSWNSIGMMLWAAADYE